jgi:undecaprenyl-diphosphatase
MIGWVIGFLRRFVEWARPRWKDLLLLFAGVLIPLVAFGLLAEDVEEGGLPWDQPVLRAIHRYATPARDRAMILISRIGFQWGSIPLAVVVFVGLVLTRRWRSARFFAVAVGGAMLVDTSAKLLFHRVRPALWVSLVRETSYSFPSGHAMGTMALSATLVVLTWPTRARWWVMALGVAFVLLVGFSRMYLGVHYPSDVLAGWAAALAWVSGVATLTYGNLLPSRRQAKE